MFRVLFFFFSVLAVLPTLAQDNVCETGRFIEAEDRYVAAKENDVWKLYWENYRLLKFEVLPDSQLPARLLCLGLNGKSQTEETRITRTYLSDITVAPGISEEQVALAVQSPESLVAINKTVSKSRGDLKNLWLFNNTKEISQGVVFHDKTTPKEIVPAATLDGSSEKTSFNYYVLAALILLVVLSVFCGLGVSTTFAINPLIILIPIAGMTAIEAFGLLTNLFTGEFSLVEKILITANITISAMIIVLIALFKGMGAENKLLSLPILIIALSETLIFVKILTKSWTAFLCYLYLAILCTISTFLIIKIKKIIVRKKKKKAAAAKKPAPADQGDRAPGGQ